MVMVMVMIRVRVRVRSQRSGVKGQESKVRSQRSWPGCKVRVRVRVTFQDQGPIVKGQGHTQGQITG